MAWVAIDNFDSYSNGDLAGNNGGSGWGGAWSINTAYDVEDTVVLQGTKSISTPSTGEPEGGRILAVATTDGSIRWLARKSASVNDTPTFWLAEAGSAEGNRVVGVALGTSSNILLRGSADNDIGDYSLDTTYTIDMEYDCSTDQARASINGGTFSSWFNFRTTESNLTHVLLRVDQSGAGSTAYYDAIQPTPGAPSGPTNLKSYNTNVKANIKSINTNLVANVKTLNTNT